MPSRITNYMANALLANVRNTLPLVSWPGLYLGLFTANPTDTGSLASEVNGSGYSRVLVEFGAASNRRILSTNVEDFPEALSPWGTVAYVGVCDAQTAGNMLFYSELQNAAGAPITRVVATGDLLRFAVGNIKLEF